MAALASGLVTSGQIDACEERLAGGGDAPRATDGRRWDEACADLMVKEGTLTRFQANQLLAGRSKLTLGQYEILEELGRGGMGQVFQARHALMGRTVAIKVLPRSKSTPDAEAAFQREIRMLARLDHENLVRALDAGHDGKVYYLVTELVPGLDLRRQVLRHGPLDAAAAASVISQAAQGLSYAHGQGLVHRDVKPSNLLVSPDGRVKVLDLGLAGSIFDEESTRLGRVVGTMDYMAPEQIRDPDAVGPQADVYALGCTLYFTLTGEPPFPGGTRQEKAKRQLVEQPRPIRQVRPGVDPALCRVVETLMRKDPGDRPRSAEAVIDLLRPWTSHQPVPMPRVNARRKPRTADATARSTGGPPLASGSSVDGGATEASHASQHATRGIGSAVDETWPGDRSLASWLANGLGGARAVDVPGSRGWLSRLIKTAARCVAVAAIIALAALVIVLAMTRRGGASGMPAAVMTGGVVFFLALGWLVRAAWRGSRGR